jgi:hypothetical protein
MAKKKTRVSGMQLEGEGLYTVQSDSGWQMDIGAVKRRIDAYLKDAAETGKYSISGLCIALEVPRSVLGLWREGYACEQDTGNTAVLPNEALSRCIEMALLHIQRYWEEADKPSSMNVKQLEATGALGESASACAVPPFDLGRLKKYSQ